MIEQPQALPPRAVTSILGTCNLLFYTTLIIVEGSFIGAFALFKYPESFNYGSSNTETTFITNYGLCTGLQYTTPLQNFIWSGAEGVSISAETYGTYCEESMYNHLVRYWDIFTDITLWVLVGYGFLISYLRFHRWSSLSFSLFIMCFSVQAYVLFAGFWQCVWWRNFSYHLYIDLRDIISGLKCAVAVLITYGSVAGKIDAFQALNIVLFETFLYTLNEVLVLHTFAIKDIGGGSYIHMFGGFYGFTTCMIYNKEMNVQDNTNWHASYGSNALTFVGTFFLWIYFPAFNCYNQLEISFTKGLETTGFYYNFHPSLFNMRFLCVMNTYWALTSSVVAACVLSMVLHEGRMIPEHILNATLAGGVMIANCADMYSYPFPALVIGAWAGTWAVIAFHLSPACMVRFKIFDTRLACLLHCIPAIWGCAASAITIATMNQLYQQFVPNAYNEYSIFLYLHYRSSAHQAGWQLIGGLICIFIGYFGGIAQGYILRIWKCFNLPDDLFADHCFFRMNIAHPEVSRHHKFQKYHPISRVHPIVFNEPNSPVSPITPAIH